MKSRFVQVPSHFNSINRMEFTRFLHSLLIVLCVVIGVFAQDYDRPHYPNPQDDPGECGRNKPSYLCDPNQILNPGEADQLDREIERVMNETDCPCSYESCSSRKYRKGYKIAVALIKKMPDDVDVPYSDGDDELTHNLDKARLYAYTLLNRWSFGKCGEDVIIFYSQDDNVLYTMTGEESEKKLKNEIVGTISMEGRGKFGSNNFEGLLNLITKYREVLSGKYRQRSVAKPQTAALTDGSTFSLASTTFVIFSSLLAAVLTL